jgi:hypothetical protein
MWTSLPGTQGGTARSSRSVRTVQLLCVNRRLCKIVKPFEATRSHNRQQLREFRIGETIWFDTDQNTEDVQFQVDHDPWIVNRNVLITSIKIPN